MAWYPFEKGTEDASGNGHDGDNYKANRERDVNGTKNGSYRFSNDKDHITIPVDINIGAMPQMAMCAWVYPFNKWDKITVIPNDDRGGDRKIFTVKEGKKYIWAISDGNGGHIGEVPVERKEWVFLAANYDEKSGYASIYVNGHKTLGRTSMDMGSAMTMIGSNAHDNEDFEAIIDEVRIYDRLLEPEEIDSLMALKNPKRLHKKEEEKNITICPNRII
ncbi:MAG: LamG domain-containing protein [Bacteroidales bacterium]|nr:LamG domain-containing protein [Bacteroidales bacterium]